MHDAASKEWKKVDSLTSAQNSSGIAMVVENTIVVIGGYSNAQEFPMEMGQVELLS